MPPGGAARRSGPQKGGSRKGDLYRINGVDLPWDPHLDLDAPRPTPLQPDRPSKITPPKELSAREKAQVAHFLAIRDKIRRGPLHAVLGEQARVGGGKGGGGGGRATFDAFNAGMAGWSSRYQARRNALPLLRTRPFVKEFFPRELWATIDPVGHRDGENARGVGKSGYKGKGLQRLGGSRKLEELGRLDNGLDEERDGESKEKGEEDGEDIVEEEEEEEEQEEGDEEFEEEDEGGDYNAEQYFDDGGDDGGEDYDAGEDGGIDYF